MKYISKNIGLLTALFVFSCLGQAQTETIVLTTPTYSNANSVSFFTNRPLVVKKDSSHTFKNSTTKQTNTLYFCNYDFDTDSIELNYQINNLSDAYPTEDMQHNILYDIYQRQRIDRGVRDFYIIVGGYGKSFKKQVNSYMQRLKTTYGDTLCDRASIIVFAWGTEDKGYNYYNALAKAKNGAADFAIFQHMLDEFISDEDFFKTHPNDLHINILFSSMGNELFRKYLINRKKQNIPLIKTYNSIDFVGSVAPRNSFKHGKAFCNIHEMTDTVDVFVNSKDYLLQMSSLLHLNNRMGNQGPSNPDMLPDYIKVHDIKNIITFKDMSGLGHDYLLTNQYLREIILKGIDAEIMRYAK